MNIIGRRIKDNKALCCLNCRYPVLLIGRLVCYFIQKYNLFLNFYFRCRVNMQLFVYNVQMNVKMTVEIVQSNLFSYLF
jgi:hypothetical protein